MLNDWPTSTSNGDGVREQDTGGAHTSIIRGEPEQVIGPPPVPAISPLIGVIPTEGKLQGTDVLFSGAGLLVAPLHSRAQDAGPVPLLISKTLPVPPAMTAGTPMKLRLQLGGGGKFNL